MKWRFERFIIKKGYFGIYWRLLVIIFIGIAYYMSKQPNVTLLGAYGGSFLTLIVILIISWILRFIYLGIHGTVSSIKDRTNYRRSKGPREKGKPSKLVATDKYKQRSYDEVMSKVTYLSKAELIKTMFNGQATRKNVGHVYVVNGDRPEGAYIILSKQELEHREKLATDEIFIRNRKERQLVDVPYFKEYSSYINKGNEKEYLYHRTHLLPYRFALSEGHDIHNLLFTGTTRVNNGNRPKYDYYVPKLYYFYVDPEIGLDPSLSQIGYFTNGQYIYEGFKHVNPTYTTIKSNNQFLQLDSLHERIGKLGLYANTQDKKKHKIKGYQPPIYEDYMLMDEIHRDSFNKLMAENKLPFFSLNDFEIFADDYIRHKTKFNIFNYNDPLDVYTYGVLCNYDNNTDIPTSVDAYLINNMTKKIILSMRFYNDL